MSELKRTPLHAFHLQHGARLVDFAGWEMPVQYRSILEEHRAVRRAAGLFDVSHMGEMDVRGPDAQRYLNHLVTNDVARLFPGRVMYSPMCYPDGGVVDDVLVYHRAPDDYFVCVNASNVDKDLAWMKEQMTGFKVTVTDRSSDYALLALQGPAAATILQPLTGAKLDRFKYYHFGEGTVAGVHCLISRTGYTGEDGFELYHAAGDAPALAAAIFDAGKPHGLELAGLGARDSLRLEAGFPLYGHELSADISPVAAGLAWTVKVNKGVPFVGEAALRKELADGSRRQVVFFRTGDRRIARPGTPVQLAGGARVGEVLSGTLSPLLNEAIGSALVHPGAVEQSLEIEIRGQLLPIQVVRPPFVPLKKAQ